jgi:hypothetical protein
MGLPKCRATFSQPLISFKLNTARATPSHVSIGSTPVIENSEPNFRKGSIAVIRSSRPNDARFVAWKHSWVQGGIRNPFRKRTIVGGTLDKSQPAFYWLHSADGSASIIIIAGLKVVRDDVDADRSRALPVLPIAVYDWTQITGIRRSLS